MIENGSVTSGDKMTTEQEKKWREEFEQLPVILNNVELEKDTYPDGEYSNHTAKYCFEAYKCGCQSMQAQFDELKSFHDKVKANRDELIEMNLKHQAKIKQLEAELGKARLKLEESMDIMEEFYICCGNYEVGEKVGTFIKNNRMDNSKIKTNQYSCPKCDEFHTFQENDNNKVLVFLTCQSCDFEGYANEFIKKYI